ncbi:hypothetical protein [Herbidospora daliensis]|uniref:hypothetical protein n=1 Tax=Herbidospora daliensis TaxID=295585 RepID=UPI0007866DF7|nr:hypothetical protein [Herbidospora daliensis]
MHLIEDVTELEIWPFGLIGADADIAAALLFAVDKRREAELLTWLAHACRNERWVSMSLSHAKNESTPPRGLYDRRPSLIRDTMSHSLLRSVSPVWTRVDWCTLDPTSPELFDLWQTIRRGKGRSGCLGLAAPDAFLNDWTALTSGVIWRNMLALSRQKSIESLDDQIIGAHLSGISASDFVLLVPLDLHPWAGALILGGPERVAWLKSILDEYEYPFPAVPADAVFSRGGRVAL